MRMDEKLTLTEKVDRLRSAGYPIMYADRFAWVRTPGTSYWADNSHHWEVMERAPVYLSYSDVHQRPEENTRVFVDLGDVARGEDGADQSNIDQLSNFRSLPRDYPEVFTRVGYSHVDLLGAYVGNLTPELVGILCELKTGDPTFDGSDQSELEIELQIEGWDSYERSDVRRKLIDESESSEAMEDMLDEMDSVDYDANHCYGPREEKERDALREIWGDAWQASEEYGHAERSSWIFPDVSEDLAERLWAARCAELPQIPAWYNPDQLRLV